MHLTNFIGSTRPLSNALEKHTLRNNQPQSWNEMNQKDGNSSLIEQNLLYKMHYLVYPTL